MAGMRQKIKLLEGIVSGDYDPRYNSHYELGLYATPHRLPKEQLQPGSHTPSTPLSFMLAASASVRLSISALSVATS